MEKIEYCEAEDGNNGLNIGGDKSDSEDNDADQICDII